MAIIVVSILSLLATFPVYAQSSTYVTLPIFPSIEAAMEASAEGVLGGPRARAGSNVLGGFLIRDGNSERVQVYLSWSGTKLISAWRFNSATIDNGSLLRPTVFGTLGQTIRNITASTKGSVHFGNVNIPVSETHGRIRFSNLQGYSMLNARWENALITGITARIN